MQTKSAGCPPSPVSSPPGEELHFAAQVFRQITWQIQPRVGVRMAAEINGALPRRRYEQGRK